MFQINLTFVIILNFMDKKTLLDNLKLEKFTRDDFYNYYQLVGNAKVMQMITGKPLTHNQAKANFELIVSNNDIHPDFGTFKIKDALTNDFIGLAKLTLKEPDYSDAELGYMLLPEYWGLGIAGMVAAELVEIGRTSGAIEKIFAIIDTENIPSAKILLRNGFVSVRLAEFDGLPGEVFELKFLI